MRALVVAQGVFLVVFGLLFLSTLTKRGARINKRSSPGWNFWYAMSARVAGKSVDEIRAQNEMVRRWTAPIAGILFVAAGLSLIVRS